ncbi:DUF563 domain-containing protein [Cephalotus follicularis]|uniref:DUF563 domain-containing protein n=1 Tax=Cephalotus follicularis TaxID=3775 RepID=A0A1Q3CNA9_CEPFO|nr:DUF563 domain-containing protein [Cephalotus follicularis]
MGEKVVYDTILARSFNKQEQKKLGYGAVIACFLLALSFCTVFKPYFGPLPAVLDLQILSGGTPEMLMVNETTSSSTDHTELLFNEASRNQKVMADNDTSSNYNNKMLMVNERSCSNKIVGANNTSSILKIVAVNVTSSSHQMLTAKDRSSSHGIVMGVEPKKMEAVCNVKETSSGFCEMKGDVRVEGKSSTVFIASSQAGNDSWSIKPYAREGDMAAQSLVREWSVKSLTSHKQIPSCTHNRSLPAIIFSSGGYAGNNFHDFTDIIVPLYLTARQFNGEVQFLITNTKRFWIYKFHEIIRVLSRYDIIDIDEEEGIHCFTQVIVGLKRYHGRKELTIDPSKSSYSMNDFRQFLRESYSLKKGTAIKLGDGEKKRPRLLILSRKRTRAFTNAGGIAKMATRLGFQVVVAEADMNVSRFAQIVNSCDVLLGVHGAGLTNIVFLPDKAVLIQVVPFGGFEWLAKSYFEEPSKSMNLRYLDYKITLEESNLILQYARDHEVLRNPTTIRMQGWEAFKLVYLNKQDVNLDVSRFRSTLTKALELLHQ